MQLNSDFPHVHLEDDYINLERICISFGINHRLVAHESCQKKTDERINNVQFDYWFQFHSIGISFSPTITKRPFDILILNKISCGTFFVSF